MKVNINMNIRHFAHGALLIVAALFLTLPLALQAAKVVPVTVTAADPSEAIQGEMKTIKITGTGFDNGSKASFLVSGTTDASQISVTAVRFNSSTELEADIQVQPAALAVSYDIEIQTSTGRKGKGTTLFKVNSDACVDTEFPTIAYVVRATSTNKRGRLTQPFPHNLMLTGDNDCTRYTLMSNYPGFRNLRFSLRDGLGVVSWIEESQPDAQGVYNIMIKGVFFEVLSGGVIAPSQPVPVILHQVQRGSVEDLYLGPHDTFLDDQGQLSIAFFNSPAEGPSNLKVLTPESGQIETVLSGAVHVIDSDGNPYKAVDWLRWSPDGNALYVMSEMVNDPYILPGIARVMRNNGVWQAPHLIVVNHQEGSWGIGNAGLSPDGRLAYYFPEHEGPSTWLTTGLIDPNLCVPTTCDVLDGAPPAGVTREGMPLMWTGSGSLLFWTTQGLGEWVDPDLGIESKLSIRDIVNRGVVDSSY